MMTKRSLLLPLMTTFDFADTTQPCSQRNVSTVAPQALALLNNEFVHEQSDALRRPRAGRSRRRSGRARSTAPGGWRLVARPATASAAAALAHLATQRRILRRSGRSDGKAARRRPKPGSWRLASLCHVLFNLNEFIYVD